MEPQGPVLSPSAAAVAEQPTEYPPSLELALLAFHRNVGPIRKQSAAKYGAFADLRTVLEAVTPALLEQGLVLSQFMDPTPEGGCLLRTELTHAPTGEKLTSSCPIPSLQSLLDRVHELRGDVLRRFPLDLQLAAIGALPPVLPPRSSDPDAVPAPPPPRQPGLRMDDQLKGLYTLLGQLGTTTNPLHALGGVTTYLRRYQVLALLCLAPTDDDGSDGTDDVSLRNGMDPRPDSVGRGGVGTHGSGGNGQGPPRAAASPQRSRSRRASGGESAQAPRPSPTPPRQSQPPTPPPAPSPAGQGQGQGEGQGPGGEGADRRADSAGSEAAAQAEPPAPSPAAAAEQDQDLIPSEVQTLIALIRTLPTERVPQLVAAFRQQFNLPQQALVSDYIRTQAHAVFIRQQVAALMPAPAAAI